MTFSKIVWIAIAAAVAWGGTSMAGTSKKPDPTTGTAKHPKAESGATGTAKRPKAENAPTKGAATSKRAAAGGLDPAAAVPPVALQVERVTSIHGDRRVDPFFWLRERENVNVRNYLEAENAYTAAVMAPTAAMQESLYAEMLGRIKQTDEDVPVLSNGWWYYSRTVEGKQYSIRARKKGTLDAPEEIVLDINELAKGEAFMSVGAFTVSDDGTQLAYTTDTVGYRQYKLFVKDLATGKTVGPLAERVGSVAWAADGATLFYSVEDEQTKRQHQLWRRALAAAEPELVHEEADEMFSVAVSRSRDRRWLLLMLGSLTTSEVRFAPAVEPRAAFKTIEPRRPDVEYDVESRGEEFFIRVNDTGRTFRLVKAPIGAPGREQWTEILPARPDVALDGVDVFADHWVRFETAQAQHRLTVVDFASGKETAIAFPEDAYTAYPGANPEFRTGTFRYTYQSLVTPPSTFDFEIASGRSVLKKQQEVLGGFDRAHYASERIWIPARDGVKVPVSLVYRKGLKKDGSAPLYLYGYGSYGYSSNATFSSSRLSLLDRGVVYAIAHVRGGSELGQPWHDAGKMASKMNTFTDFIDVADALVERRYVAGDRIVASGGSAGGLLMGAVANLRPDRWRAIVSYVPFVDVLNTMLDAGLPLTVGEYEEWGNPNLAEQYRQMRAYCPYSNLAAKAYPAMLVKTSFMDSQVMYWEPAKYVARLRTLKTDRNPLLLKTEMAGGHGGRSGRYDALKDVAFDFAFVLSVLDIGK